MHRVSNAIAGKKPPIYQSILSPGRAASINAEPTSITTWKYRNSNENSLFFPSYPFLANILNLTQLYFLKF
jgi:hypothetical protein